jgi:hypothetical protein
LEASAHLKVVAGGMDSIRVDFPGVDLDDLHSPAQFTLGAGEADIRLVAGSD